MNINGVLAVLMNIISFVLGILFTIYYKKDKEAQNDK